MTLSRTFILVAGFVIGCGAGSAASSIAVPPASAQNIQRWDYYCVTEWGAQEVTLAAQRLGKEGWEMTGAATTPNRAVWCFKRPL